MFFMAMINYTFSYLGNQNSAMIGYWVSSEFRNAGFVPFGSFHLQSCIRTFRPHSYFSSVYNTRTEAVFILRNSENRLDLVLPTFVNLDSFCSLQKYYVTIGQPTTRSLCSCCNKILGDGFSSSVLIHCSLRIPIEVGDSVFGSHLDKHLLQSCMPM